MALLTSKQILQILTGRDDWKVSGVFGEFAKPRTKAHTGTDFETPLGTELKVPTNNTLIVSVRNDINRSSATTSFGADYGNYTVLYVPEWDRTYVTAHEMFHTNTYAPGTILDAGVVYSKTGGTGLSTGPHLHISVAKGKRLSLTDVLNHAIDFMKDIIHISPIGNPSEKPKPADELVILPKGTQLYKADGTKYPKLTTQSHTVQVTETIGDLKGFTAGWLQGTTFAYFKAAKVEEKPSFLGKNVTIPKGYKLYKPDGTHYPEATTKSHSVRISQVMKNGLLKFSAPWLKGVQVAYLKQSDFE